MNKTSTYSDGTWIVHAQYGIGEIKGIDAKSISGEESHYYRIQSKDSTFWIPIDQIDSDIIRPLSTEPDIEQAISVLHEPADELSTNTKVRLNQIHKAQNHNTPEALASLIRDLQAQKQSNGSLNNTERNAYRNSKQRLVEEWAIVTGQHEETVTAKIENLLNQSENHK